MTKSVTITLDGTAYEIKDPLTLDQLIDLQVAVVVPDTGNPQEDLKRGMQRAIDTIAAALKEDYPQMNAPALRKLRITAAEVVAASSAVLEMSGLIPKKDQKPGEAVAGAA